MYTTTPQYDSAVYGQTREIKAKLEFEIVDVDAYADTGTLTVTGENALSQKAQTTDLVRNLSGKYATFEEDYWLLDGTFLLPPKTGELASYQTGSATTFTVGAHAVNQYTSARIPSSGSQTSNVVLTIYPDPTNAGFTIQLSQLGGI